MSFMKFSKGKAIYSVPNGLGDGSAYFDDSSDTCTILKYPLGLPSGNSARTISFWLWQYKNSYGDTLFGYGTNSNAGWIYIYASNGKLEKSGYNLDYTSSVEIAFEKWQHVVFTYDGVSSNKFYLNGVLAETFEQGGYNTVEKEGYTRIACGADDKKTRCNMKDINVYNRALSAEEVTTLYNKGTVTDGLVLNVPLTYGKDDESIFSSKSFVYDYATLTTSSGFDEFGYPIRYDIASEAGVNYATYPKDGLLTYVPFNGENVTPTGETLTNASGTVTYGMDGKIPYAEFDGSSYLTMNNVDKWSYYGEPFSMSCWIKDCNTQTIRFFVSYGSNSENHAFGLGVLEQRLYTWGSFNSANEFATQSDVFDSTKWSHIVFNRYSDHEDFYVNGVKVATFDWHLRDVRPNVIVFGYGCNFEGSPYIGKLSTFRYYNRVLTEKEIQQLAKEF